MIKKLRLLIGSLSVLLIIGLVFTYSNKETKEKSEVDLQRESYAEFLKNSPYQETLTWDKKKRKLNGLPPNRYFEQLWELTIDPSTGKLNDGKLSELRMQIIQERAAKKNPGDTGNAWEERGPNNVGGRTRVIMFDPNDSSNNTVYAGGVSGGLWKNTNVSSSGSTWSRVENVPGNLSVTSITVDPRNSNIWYVGTGEQYTAGDVVGNGVYMTTNGGASWSAINIPPADGGDINYNASNLFLSGIYYVNDVLAWDNGSSTELFVAVGAHVYGDSSDPRNWLGLQTAGLYHSTDGGSNWNRIQTSNMQHTFGGETYYYIPNDLEVGADNKLWMGTIGSALGEGGGRVYSSTNGSSWTEAAASPLTDSNRVELEPSATNANKLYALTQGNTSPVHIYETTNGFGSISTKSLPNDADTGIASNDFCRGQAFYDLVIEADPANDNIVYVGGIDLFKSTNGGSSWSQLSHWYGGFGYQEVHADQHSIAFGNNSSSKMLFGNDGGIYYSGNSGSTISVRNTGYNVTQFVKAGIGPDGVGDTNGIFSAGAQDNGTQAFRDGNTSAGINPSEELSDGDGFYTFVDKDGQYMIATYVRNVIYRFNLPWNGQGRIDGGATTLFNDSSTTGDFVNQMDYDSDANRLLSNKSTSSSNAILSINVASNSNGTLTNSALTGKPTAFRASPFANNTWYVGMANGGLLKLTNVGNSSATWATKTTPFVGSVSSVRFGETSNDLIVTMHNYGVTSVWYSSNDGASWTSKEGNLPDIPVRDFLLNPLNTNEAIIATQLGVWGTSDFNSANPIWIQSYNGMSDVSVTSLDYWDVSGDDTNNKVIASTYGRGVFTGSFTATSVPDTEAPTIPTNLVASNITESTVDLSWNASSDNVGVSGYDVYQGATKIASVSTNSYTVTGLSANTTYAFSIIAKDAAGNESTTSNTVNATTLAPDTEAPTAPTNLSASNVTDSSASLSWNSSSDNVGVSGYDVYQGATKIGTVTGTTFQVTGLSADTGYSFTVIALDAAGNQSLASNQVSITTDSVPVTYCTSSGNTSYQTAVSRVIFGTIDNIDGPAKDVGYEDFTNLSTTVTRSSSENLTVYVNTDGNYRVDAIAWIDWNRNGNFTDSGEAYDLGNISNVANGALPTLSVSIPSNAVIGSTRMRVSARYNSDPTSCQTSFDGEVEDYTVVVVDSGPDETAPVITLNGNSTINLNVGDSYTEQGATASDNIDGDISSNIIVGGDTVNTSVANTYVATYNVSDAAGNNAAEVTRTVNVAPDTTAPIITLVGNSTINLNVGDSYTEQGATATDNLDGDISSNIIVGGDTVNISVANTYVVTYNVSDAAGNNAVEVTRIVNVAADTTAPIITLVGNSTINLNVGDSYTEQGATATDNLDGDISSNIVIGGDVVNTSVANSYVVTYNVSDAAGNSASQVTRTVNVSIVQDTTAPVITLIGDTTVNLTVGDTYTEQGATASDNIDGDISANIVVGGDAVNTSVANTYVVTYNVSDAAGNTATQVTRTVVVSNVSSNTVLNEGFFETGWDGWSDGGRDCARVSSSRSFEGSYSIRLRDNSGTQSAMTSPSFNITSFSQVEVTFHFYAYSMENNEDFWLRYYNGSSWTTIATYARGTDFNNNTFYSATVTLDASQFNFATNSQFRFQCDASGNNDQIYVDQVTITGITGAPAIAEASITELSINTHNVSGVNNEGFDIQNFEFEEDFSVYPNPVSSDLTIRLGLDIEEEDVDVSMNIYDIRGRIVKTKTWNSVTSTFFEKRIDVSDLSLGVYMINVVSSNGMNESEKLIVK